MVHNSKKLLFEIKSLESHILTNLKRGFISRERMQE